MNIFKIVMNIATRTGHEGIVRLLVESGADVNAANMNIDTALITAIRKGMHKNAKSFLIKTKH